MACIATIALCMGQNSDRRFYMTVRDQAGELVDVSDATAISFTVWNEAGGTQVFTKTLAAADVQINSPSQFNFLVDSTDSTIAAATYYCEAWITNSASEQQPVAKGTFEIEDTTEKDA